MTQTKVADLLSEMAKVLSIKVDQLRILRAAYSPKGWADDEDKMHRPGSVTQGAARRGTLACCGAQSTKLGRAPPRKPNLGSFGYVTA